MLLRLTFKNAMNRARDYAAYLIACVAAIVVYFCFISIETDPVLTHLKTAGERLIFGGTIGVARIIILLFVIFFLAYANLFFVKKRKQEIGILSVIGVTKLQISFLFFGESLIIGLIAILIGLLLGVFLSKLFAMLLLRMMGIAVAMPFLISWKAIRQTTGTFGFLFLMIGFLNSTLIFRYRLVDLLHPTRMAKKMKHPTGWTYLWGTIGIALIAGGYYLAEKIFTLMPMMERQFGYKADLFYLLAILLFEIIGTLAFFQSYIQIWLQFERRWKRLYYRGTHLLSVSNLSYRFRKNAKTLWMITILSAVTITAIGSTAMIYTYGQSQLKQNIPADLIYTQLQKSDVEALMARYHVTPKSKTVIDYKIIAGNFKLNSPLLQDGYQQNGATTVISLSQYNQMMASQFDRPATHLEPQEAVAIVDMPLTMLKIPRSKALKPVQRDHTPLNLYQSGLTHLEVIRVRKLFPNGPAIYFESIQNMVVVADAQYQRIQADVTDQIHTVNLTKKDQQNKPFMAALLKYTQTAKKQAYLVTEKGKRIDHYRLTIKKPQQTGDTRNEVLIKKPNQALANANFGFYLYIMILIALIFMLATGSIIMLKQLSEAQEEILQYQTLKKIGMSMAEIKHSIYFQILMIFLLPIILGTLHAIFAIRLLSLFLDNPGLQLVYIVCGIFIMIYLMFYLLTAKIYNRIVNRPLYEDTHY